MLQFRCSLRLFRSCLGSSRSPPCRASIQVPSASTGFITACFSPSMSTAAKQPAQDSVSIRQNPPPASAMTVVATKFTPEVLLSAPRRSAGSPNCKGEKVLFTVSTYSFDEHKKTSRIKVLDVQSGQTTVLYEDATYSEPTWVGENEFIFIKGGDNGSSSLMLGDITRPGKNPKEIYSVRGSISNLKVKALSNSTILLACAALATPEGEMYNPAKDDKKVYHTGKVYSELFVRHWDSYITKNRNAIWYGRLKWNSLNADDSNTLTLEQPGLINALAGTALQSPVPPFGGSGDFDISPYGIAFVSRDPDVNPATHTKSSVYFMNIDFSASALPVPGLSSVSASPIKTPGLEGYSAGPAFGPDGRSLVFTRMRHIQYESDKPRLLQHPDVVGQPGAEAREFFKTDDGEGGWDLRPESPLWSADGKQILVIAEDKGSVKLFRLPAMDEAAGAQDATPTAIVHEGAVGDVRRLPDGKLFVSSSSLVDGSMYTIVDPATAEASVVSSLSKHGKAFGLSPSQRDDIWFKGAGDYDVHALVMRPSGFDAGKKYPLAFLIHGGPQGAWGDSWSTRWNPAIFAEQGYVAVCPNPTGSTGYGMALENGIQNNWGGRPYEDLVKCFDYIAQNMPYVDMDRAVALGASYGGYMINWIQGHPLGRRFKALVCHDGVFSTLNQYSSEELFFPLHDFGGTLWENREGYEKWDPARHLDQWATPQLVIHNELDYRLPISEGLAAFNVLQSRGVPSRFLTFPDENHWTLKPENSLLWHQEVLGWINKYSGVKESKRTEVART